MRAKKSFLLSFAAHAFLLFGTAGLMIRQAGYEVESGSGGMEISLIAAPPAEKSGSAEAQAQIGDRGEAAILPPVRPAAEARVAGDGSSPVPGNDPVTLYLAGGAASGKSGRFRNPAPEYPYRAIVEGQQGVVMLDVSIDSGGRPTAVEINRSSGFPLLDQSAFQTVRRWRFGPAHVGFVPVQAKIRVPVRFVLENGVKRRLALRQALGQAE